MDFFSHCLFFKARRIHDRYTFQNPNSEYETTVLDPHLRPIPNPIAHTASVNYNNALLSNISNPQENFHKYYFILFFYFFFH